MKAIPASIARFVPIAIVAMCACASPDSTNTPPTPAGEPAAQLVVPAVSAPRVPDGPFNGIYSWHDWYTAPLGIGHLHPVQHRDYGAEWIRRVALPLRSAPEGEPWGWVVQGWIVEQGEERPFDMAGMVETSYEELTLIVEEERGEWLRFRYGGPAMRDSGFAWVRRSELSLGQDSIIYQTWPALFTSDLIGPLFFRGADAMERGTGSPAEPAWALYAQPGAQNASPHVLTRDHAIEPIEVQGEWMRVRVTEPSNYCQDPERVTVTEGWIRWWTPVRGPEVWYHTRGC